MNWTARIDYDGGRLGHAFVCGLATREDAIAWLERGLRAL